MALTMASASRTSFCRQRILRASCTFERHGGAILRPGRLHYHAVSVAIPRSASILTCTWGFFCVCVHS
jgi:hypothetical protein